MNLTCPNCNKVYKKPKCFDNHTRICDTTSHNEQQNNILKTNIIDDHSRNIIHNYTDWLRNITLDDKSTFEYLKNNTIENLFLFIIKNNIQTSSPFYSLNNTIIIWNDHFRYFNNDDIIKIVSHIHQKITQIVCTWNQQNLHNIKIYDHYQSDYYNILDKIFTSFKKNKKRIYSSIKQLINNIVS